MWVGLVVTINNYHDNNNNNNHNENIMSNLFMVEIKKKTTKHQVMLLNFTLID